METSPHPTVPRQVLQPLLSNLGKALVDIVFPVTCTGCGERIAASDQPICDLCVGRLVRANTGEAMARILAHVGPCPFTSAIALWTFDKGGMLQQMHRSLKYGNRPRFGLRLGTLMASAIPEHTPLDAIIPIPLHRQRYLTRGYNQSTTLAEGLAAKLGVPVAEDLLHRTRPTRSQTRLSRAARRQNVTGAFATSTPERIEDKHLLLVDDVLTTGATVLAAADVLHAYKPASLHCVTMAIA